MKQFLSIFFSFLFALHAHAGLVLERIDGTIWDQVERLRVPNNQITKLGDKRYRLETGNENVLKNPNFQAIVAGDGWTINTANLDSAIFDENFAFEGVGSLQLDLKQGNYTDLELISQTYPAGYKLGGADLEAFIRIAKGSLDPAVQLKWCAHVDGVLANCVIVPTSPANTYFQKYSTSFSSKPAFATTYKVGLYATYNVTTGVVGVLNLATAGLQPYQGRSAASISHPPRPYSATLSFGSGAADNYTFTSTYERNGDKVRIRAKMYFNGPSASFSTPRVSFPLGIAPDYSKVPQNEIMGLARGVISGVGLVVRTHITPGPPENLQVSVLSTLSGTNPVTVGTGSITQTGIVANDYIAWDIEFPVLGWNESNSVTPSNGANLLGTHFYTRASQCPANSVSDNATITRAQYPDLFANWGIAAGTNTLTLSNAGLVIRSTGSQTFGGKTYTATLNQKRNDELASHYHEQEFNASTDGSLEKFGVVSSVAGSANRRFAMRDTGATTANAPRTGNTGSGTETHGPDIAQTGCYWAVANPFLPISGMVVSSDASAAGQSTVINTVKTITSNYTLTGEDETLNINAAGATGNITVSLPSAALYPGKKYNLRITSGNYHATIDGFGAEGICGQPTIKVAGSNDGITIQSATTGWIGLDGACQRTISMNYYGANTTTVCSGSPCTVDNSYGGNVTLTRIGAGQYQANFASGFFSSAPKCTWVAMNGSNHIYPLRGGIPTVTTYYVSTPTTSGSYVDTYGDIICTGPR